MFEFLFSDANVPYMGALAVLGALLALEVFGLLVGYSFMDGSDADGDYDHNFDGDADGIIGNFLHWVGVGRVPLLVLVAIFAGYFSIIGLTVNHITSHYMGFMFPALFSFPFVFLATLPLLGKSSAWIAKYLPRDETNVISVNQLVGQVGIITNGNATDVIMAFARVYDSHGVQHNVRVFSSTDEKIPERSQIRLDSYDADRGHFLATKI